MTVSIVLPIYNRAHTLARCLASVRAQTETDWELLAVDDGSTDDSAGFVEALGDARIRVLRHERNRGAAAARNTALAAAQGEYVALIDSDDEWLPRKLELQLAWLRGEELDGCGCEYSVHENGAEWLVRLPAPKSWAHELQTHCPLANGTTLVAKRDSLQAIGPLDEELRIYEDWDWMLRFAGRFRYDVLPEPLARIHASGPRDPEVFARSAERFLTQHRAVFGREASRVRSLHYEYVAANALAQRQFSLGCRYVAKSLVASPFRRPALGGALLLAPLDALCGSSWLARVAGWKH